MMVQKTVGSSCNNSEHTAKADWKDVSPWPFGFNAWSLDVSRGMWGLNFMTEKIQKFLWYSGCVWESGGSNQSKQRTYRYSCLWTLCYYQDFSTDYSQNKPSNFHRTWEGFIVSPKPGKAYKYISRDLSVLQSMVFKNGGNSGLLLIWNIEQASCTDYTKSTILKETRTGKDLNNKTLNKNGVKGRTMWRKPLLLKKNLDIWSLARNPLEVHIASRQKYTTLYLE